MRRNSLGAALALVLLIASSVVWAHAQSVTSINIYTFYDPAAGQGFVVYNLTLAGVSGPTILYIALPSDNVTRIVSVANYSGSPLPYQFFPQNNSVAVAVYGSTGITITYTVSGLFYEAGIGTYTAIIDTTSLPADPTWTIVIPGDYSVSCSSQCSYAFDPSSNATTIRIMGRNVFLLSLMLPLGATATTGTTTTATARPSPTASPTPPASTPLTTSAPGSSAPAGTTQAAGRATSSVQSTSAPSTASPLGQQLLTAIAIAIIVVAAIAIVATRRR
ncbi:MAG: hypothetical protein ABWK00_05230 [Desulfurococcaceae archaeon]